MTQAPRLLAVTPPDWHTDLRAMRLQLQDFAVATATLGSSAAVYLRAHDRPLAAWQAWLAALDLPSLAPLRVGITAPSSGPADLSRHGVAFMHLPEAMAPQPWPASGLVFSRARHAPGPADGAAWLVVSPVFATSSKPGAAPLGVEGLRACVVAADAPVVALGGLDAATAALAFAAGAHGIACLRAAWTEPAALALACLGNP